MRMKKYIVSPSKFIRSNIFAESFRPETILIELTMIMLIISVNVYTKKKNPRTNIEYILYR